MSYARGHEGEVEGAAGAPARPPGAGLSGPSAVFRLSIGRDAILTVALHQRADSPLAADIAFRFLQRLSLATAERLERLLAAEAGGAPVDVLETQTLTGPTEVTAGPPVVALAPGPAAWAPFGWLRAAWAGERPGR